jgi:hypothetical protein
VLKNITHEKSFVLDMGNNDTKLCSILSPWKKWFHCHWKKQIDGCTQGKQSMEKIPPDIQNPA